MIWDERQSVLCFNGNIWSDHLCKEIYMVAVTNNLIHFLKHFLSVLLHNFSLLLSSFKCDSKFSVWFLEFSTFKSYSLRKWSHSGAVSSSGFLSDWSGVRQRDRWPVCLRFWLMQRIGGAVPQLCVSRISETERERHGIWRGKTWWLLNRVWRHMFITDSAQCTRLTLPPCWE